MALVAHNALGASSILYYLVAYTLMSLGAFTVLMVVARREGPLYAFGDYAGLGTTAHGFLASRVWMSILRMPCSSVRS